MFLYFSSMLLGSIVTLLLLPLGVLFALRGCRYANKHNGDAAAP